MSRAAFCLELTDQQRTDLACAVLELRAAARRLGDMEERERRGMCFTYERESAGVDVRYAESKLIAFGVPL